MKDLSHPDIDRWRDRSWKVREYFGSVGGSSFGVFHMPSPVNNQRIKILASNGECGMIEMGPAYAWDHVSASLQDRVPSYEEMCWIKDVFFEPDETAVQYHVPASDHVNYHPYCLHLWRPTILDLPRPPSILVGPKGRKL